MKKYGISSRWPVQKGWEASARQWEMFRLGRVLRHYCTPLASFECERRSLSVAVTMSSGSQDTSSGQSVLKDAEAKVGSAWESTKESVSEAFTSAKETISDKYRDLTGQKSAQEKAQDKASEAVDHLKETGQSAKESLQHAADAASEKLKDG